MKATLENSNLLEFFEFVLALKTIPRKGWQKRLGMKNPESVSDHTFGVAVLSMILSDRKGLDSERAIKMALLHDLAESVTGDIVPGQMSPAKKKKLEHQAMKKILSGMAPQYRTIWSEYEKGKSDEAQLVRQIDKLEMAFQARHYKKSGASKAKLAPFFDSARKQITDSDIVRILDTVEKYTH